MNLCNDAPSTAHSSFYFSKKVGFDILCETSFADHSHEMSRLIFSGIKNKKRHFFRISYGANCAWHFNG